MAKRNESFKKISRNKMSVQNAERNRITNKLQQNHKPLRCYI